LSGKEGLKLREGRRDGQPPMSEYKLVIGIVGIVFDVESESEARQRFDQFVIQSKTTGSRFFAEPVMLLKNDEIVQEYRPPEA
jgi:hypothetical protein